jgi:hypothetical protein
MKKLIMLICFFGFIIFCIPAKVNAQIDQGRLVWSWKKCTTCNGKGYHSCDSQSCNNGYTNCTYCSGSGYRNGKECPVNECNNGKVKCSRCDGKTWYGCYSCNGGKNYEGKGGFCVQKRVYANESYDLCP